MIDQNHVEAISQFMMTMSLIELSGDKRHTFVVDRDIVRYVGAATTSTTAYLLGVQYGFKKQVTKGWAKYTDGDKQEIYLLM